MGRIRTFCVVLLLVTAAIHLAVLPEHYHEWKPAASFFGALTLTELTVAIGLLVSSNARWLLVGIGLSLATVALWTLSRTWGLPVGPEAFRPEAAGVADIASAVMEMATAAALMLILRKSPFEPQLPR